MKEKSIGHLKDARQNLYQKMLYATLMLISSPAFAGLAEKDTIEAALDSVIFWLTGTIGLSAGTLAVVGAGFAGLTGRMPIAYLKTIGISLGIIYSAAYLADMIIG